MVIHDFFEYEDQESGVRVEAKPGVTVNKLRITGPHGVKDFVFHKDGRFIEAIEVSK